MLGKLTLEMAVGFCLASITVMAQQTKDVPPIIDVHLHALPANSFGSPTPPVCTGDKDLVFAPIDPKNGYSLLSMEACSAPMQAPQSDEQLQRDTLDRLDKYNIAAVTSGSPELVSKWREISPKRIIPGLAFNLHGAPSVETLRQLYRVVSLAVFGEAMTQYEGISPDDPAWEPYFALCEELDIPVGIHTGLGPPGASYFSSPKYRARISNPLLLEDVLVRHPKLRLYVMHAGWPMSDQMVALLYAHPQVYVDVAVIDWAIRAENSISTCAASWRLDLARGSCSAPTKWSGRGQLTSRSRGFVPQTSSRKNRNETSFITTQYASCDGTRANSSHRDR